MNSHMGAEHTKGRRHGASTGRWQMRQRRVHVRICRRIDGCGQTDLWSNRFVVKQICGQTDLRTDRRICG